MEADDSIKQIKDLLEGLEKKEQPKLEVLDRSLSGNKIHGGRITKFQSTGIADQARDTILYITDNGIKVSKGDAKFEGDVEVDGHLTVDRLYVNHLTSDDDHEQIKDVLDVLDALGIRIEDLENKEEPKLEILDRSLSGNKIHGGRITKFQSTGIADLAKDTTLYITDRGIKVANVESERWLGDAVFDSDVKIEGHLTVDKLHVNKLTSDNRLERSSSLDFAAEGGRTVVGKGLQWRVAEGPSKQLIYREGAERIWSSEDFDLQKGKVYRVNNREVLNENELGPSVTKSNLNKVGTLQNLRVMGDLNIDEFMIWNSNSGRLGIGTDAPNAMLSLVSFEAEYIVDVDRKHVRTGTWTTDDLHIITDDTTRIVVGRTGKISLGTRERPTTTTVHGHLNVNVNNPDNDVDIETAGPVRIAGRRFDVGAEPPKSGAFKAGDIMWNDNPKPTGWVGWVCVRSGTPGLWKQFGQIGS